MMKRSLLTLCAFSLLAAPACVVKVNGGSTDPDAKANPAESTEKVTGDAADAADDATDDATDAAGDATEEMVPAGDAAGEAPENTVTQPGKPAAEADGDVANRPK